VRKREFQPTRSLVQAERRAASGGLDPIAQGIGRASLEFGVALANAQVLRRHRVTTNLAHLSYFTISAACRGGLGHTQEPKRQTQSKQRSMHWTAVSWKRASSSRLPLQFTRMSIARAAEPAGKFRRFWEEDEAGEGQPPIRRLRGAARRLCRAPGLSPRSDPPRPRGRPTI
jgi:hypothetical protein